MKILADTTTKEILGYSSFGTLVKEEGQVVFRSTVTPEPRSNYELTGSVGNWSVTEKSTEDKAAQANARATTVNRDRRYKLLRESDFVSSKAHDLRIAVPTEWETYRTALRDITLHANWPHLVEADWPASPDRETWSSELDFHPTHVYVQVPGDIKLDSVVDGSTLYIDGNVAVDRVVNLTDTLRFKPGQWVHYNATWYHTVSGDEPQHVISFD